RRGCQRRRARQTPASSRIRAASLPLPFSGPRTRRSARLPRKVLRDALELRIAVAANVLMHDRRGLALALLELPQDRQQVILRSARDRGHLAGAAAVGPVTGRTA